MGWFSNDSDQAAAYEQVNTIWHWRLKPPFRTDKVINAPHKTHLTHELIAAAASYEVLAQGENGVCCRQVKSW